MYVLRLKTNSTHLLKKTKPRRNQTDDYLISTYKKFFNIFNIDVAAMGQQRGGFGAQNNGPGKSHGRSRYMQLKKMADS